MIVNYIDIDFAASTIQEDFNEATKIGRASCRERV